MNVLNRIIAALVLLVEFSLCTEDETMSETLVNQYLTNYGYLDKTGPRSSALISHEEVILAIKRFQKFNGLNITGVADEMTVKLMKTPRCGVPDVIGKGSMNRKKRYVLQGSRWSKRNLTYRITRFTSHLKTDVVKNEIRRALEVWSNASGLTFTEQNHGSATIKIMTAKGDHGDGEKFDGPGKILAHAFFPQFNGEAHFDEEETWTANSYYGSNLFQTAAHEFGHSLGLLHSDAKGALMRAHYYGYNPAFRLSEDDIEAIQALYGPPKNKPSLEAPTPTKPRTDMQTPPFDICETGSFDAITTTYDKNTYAFKGDYYWLLNDESFEEGYPRKISSDWTGLPGDLDAALTWSDGTTFFFKGDRYYKFLNQRRMSILPKLIKSGFSGIPDNIDAAFMWGKNGKTYFIKGKKYWKFDSRRSPAVDFDYPKELEIWNGLPQKIDAAFQWINGKTYFFSGPNYYRFNDKLFTVDNDFPRSSAIWWFGCENPDSIKSKNLLKSKLSDDDYYNIISDNLDSDNSAVKHEQFYFIFTLMPVVFYFVLI